MPRGELTEEAYGVSLALKILFFVSARLSASGRAGFVPIFPAFLRERYAAAEIPCRIFVDAGLQRAGISCGMKNSFRIVPLTTEDAERARRAALTGRSDHEIVIADAPTAFPCRHCLRWAEPGEAMVLFPYQTVPADRPYGECGPIFVHQEACERYSAVAEYPAAFGGRRVLRGYNASDEIIAAELAEADPESVIERMLTNPEISFLQVRSVTYGCFTMKVERAS